MKCFAFLPIVRITVHILDCFFAVVFEGHATRSGSFLIVVVSQVFISGISYSHSIILWTINIIHLYLSNEIHRANATMDKILECIQYTALSLHIRGLHTKHISSIIAR